MQRKSLLKKNMHLSVLSALGCMFFLFATNPDRLPVAFLLVMPALITLFVVGVSRISMLVFSHLSLPRIMQLSVVLGFGVMVVTVLGSLSQLGLQDFILLAALVGGVTFYLRRFQTQS